MELKPRQITFVIAYYNEEEFLVETLLSLANQTRVADKILLIDNNSTDGSTTLAHAFFKEHPELNYEILLEERPGKVNALELACQHLDTEYSSFGDADTIYPPHYVELICKLYSDLPSKVSGLMALPLFEEMDQSERDALIHDRISSWKAHPSKCFTGGFGQTFKTEDLLAVGGYSFKQWPYCLMDHEIVNRIHRRGESYYHPDLWCSPSSRREGKREAVRWNLWERMVYRFTPKFLNDWVFYKFLWKSFKRRNLYSINLRQQNWVEAPDSPQH